MTIPARGEIWTVDLNPTRGLKQSDMLPALVISVDLFNRGPAGLAVVLPMTSRAEEIPFHVAVRPPDGGMREEGYVKCQEVRSISRDRLTRRWGTVSPETMIQVEDRLKILFDL